VRPRYFVLHVFRASSFAEEEGKGEELISSSHTSCAALRAASLSPLAAFSQTPSILCLVLADSVEAAWTPLLQAATAAATAGLLDVVEVVVVAAGVELLEEELELPQPASSTPPTNATVSHVESLRIMFPPWFLVARRIFDRARVAPARWPPAELAARAYERS
jgi:hypothetical protein